MNATPTPKARLFVSDPLGHGTLVTVSDQPAHYLANVLRLREGDFVGLFNGRDGEWRASITNLSKRAVILHPQEQIRPQTPVPDIWLLFAPIKSGRIDWLAEKATELGVAAMGPVKTGRTIVSRVNEERLLSHAIEASEQTGRVDIPELFAYRALEDWLADWPEDRALILCDETGQGGLPSQVLPSLKGRPAALLTGPEGGFTPSELERLRSFPYVVSMTLGPRVLRADTAALAALTCLQLHVGDWHEKPAFGT